MSANTLSDIKAYEIIDNRGMPTIRVTVCIDNQFWGHADVPSGSSTGSYEAIEIAIKCVGLIPREKLKIMRIKNTSLLSEVEISQAYEDEISKRDDLEVVSPKREMQFDVAGNLRPFIA